MCGLEEESRLEEARGGWRRLAKWFEPPKGRDEARGEAIPGAEGSGQGQKWIKFRPILFQA